MNGPLKHEHDSFSHQLLQLCLNVVIHEIYYENKKIIKQLNDE